MKKLLILTIVLGAAWSCGGSDGGSGNGTGGGDNPGDNLTPVQLAERNTRRAMEIVDAAIPAYFEGEGMLLSEYYNPFTGQKAGTGGSDASIWKYTSAIEAVNAILHALEAHKENGNSALYNDNFERYSTLLAKLYRGAQYYKGTFSLTSYTQTKEWSVYAVPRGNTPGGANPGGDNMKYNVYDDQMWLIRELIEAWRATGVADYLTEAEYLADYVLDGWDCTLDSNGTENGGIPWGPGYVTKHSCSNGPMISPLVWLHEIYKGKEDSVTYGYIEDDNSRATRTVKKADYYLDFAQRIYAWQKKWLRRTDGVYHDMRGGCGGEGDGCNPRYETVNGVRYRTNSQLTTSGGSPLTYNTGSMLSGAADLYRATGNEAYLNDVKELSVDSFAYFAKDDSTLEGYHSWPLTGSTWNPWFNGVLMRAYADAVKVSCTEAVKGVESFQQNLDYGYGKFNKGGFLPVNLLAGWSLSDANNRVNVMFTCSFAAEYAILAQHELEKLN
jgi:hypothetical protein